MDGKKSLTLITIIGLIAACITIFVFITGLQSVRDIFRHSRPAPTVLFTPNLSNKAITETSTSTTAPAIANSITSTPLRLEYYQVDTGANYVVEQAYSGKTSVAVVLKAPSGFPFDSQGFGIIPVVKDITGNWQLSQHYSIGDFILAPQGIGGTDLSESGYYLLIQHREVYYDQLSGLWGNTTIEPYYGLVFPTIEGQTTKISIQLSRLQVGILDSNGTKARTDVYVVLNCQGYDVANNVISDPNCSDVGYGSYSKPDATGIATFYTGPGKYYISYFLQGGLSDKKYLYDIEVSSGEEKRVIVNYP
jgi:hypothetical protein